ncbi:predicted protein [Nematostella vectensis]|uniref:Ionotropic glutamate receptor L-glutamate and glycine-binding domain-containing protein n=1 Tax=Nematostella vectensis TaxID=45351 RepID=A7S0X0_NEMVE|nr:predicted protein [Nematostella vectensis]|eukprot:XP_001634678.1 predicted protein [Nematostella vectensis]
MEPIKSRDFLILYDDTNYISRVSHLITNSKLKIKFVSGAISSLFGILDEFCGKRDGTVIIGCLGGRMDSYFAFLAHRYVVKFFCARKSPPDTPLQDQPYVTIGASPASISSVITQLVEKSSTTHVILLGTLTQQRDILPLLLTQKQTRDVLCSALPGNSSLDLNALRHKKYPVLIMLLKRFVNFKERSLRDTLYILQPHVNTVVFGPGNDVYKNGLGGGNLFFVKMMMTLGTLIRNAIKFSNETKTDYSTKKCLNSTLDDSMRQVQFNRSTDTAQLLEDFNVKLSFDGQQDNTVYRVEKILSNNTKKMVGSISNGKLMGTIDIHSRRKCRNPRSLCVVAAEIDHFVGLREVTDPRQCSLSHICTRFVKEIGENKDNRTREVQHCYSGLMFDLLLSLERDLEINAEVYLVMDESFGIFDEKKGTWNGMVGDLVEGKAEMALTTLQVSPSMAISHRLCRR